MAIREFPLGKDHADYALFVDKKMVGVIEAKPEGTTLSGVAEQSQTYLTGISKSLQGLQSLPPFAYETTGVETFFRDLRDPDTRSRRVFAFHKPETLYDWMSTQETVRTNLKKMNLEHPLILDRLRDCQIGAIKNLEKSFANSRPRSLIQMATGSGKTFTAVSSIYRLIKFAAARRILFLVDRSNLGRQTFKEFQQYVTPDDGRNNDIRNSERIVNVVTTADLRQPVQIQRLNDFSWGRFDLVNNYNGRVGYVKDDHMQGRVTVFASGKLISTGGESVNHSFLQLNRTMILLFQSKFIKKIKLKPQVRNIVGIGDSKKRIDLNLMAKVVNKSVYEPEMFPGLILKKDDGPTCLIFASGKVVVSGARSEIEFFNTQKWLQQKIREFRIRD